MHFFCDKSFSCSVHPRTVQHTSYALPMENIYDMMEDSNTYITFSREK